MAHKHWQTTRRHYLRPMLVAVTTLLLVVIGVWVGGVGAAAMKKDAAAREVVDPAQVVTPAEGFVLLLSGNWRGHLEPCGCSDKQLGGIDRRTKLLSLFEPSRRLLLDAGPLIRGEGIQPLLKLETFLYALGELDYDALTLTSRELVLTQREMDLQADQRPVIVTSNLQAAAQEEYETAGHLRKTLQVDTAQLPCVVLGIATGEQKGAVRIEDEQIIEPVPAAQQQLQELDIDPEKPSKDHLVVVLFGGTADQLPKELAEIPALDIIVTASYADEPALERKGDEGAVVVSTGLLGKYVTVLAIPPGADAAQMKDYKFQALEVLDTYVKDAAVVELMDDYQFQLQIQDLVADEGKLPRRPLEVGNEFVGNATCGQADSGCHGEIFEKWSQFKHAQAIETLIELNRQYDPECVRCHVVGMDFEGGYRSLDDTPELADVGCEMCHGPGWKHIVEDPYAPYREVFTPCEQCHDHESSPAFEDQREEYFEKIKHWDDEPRAWWH